MSGVVKYGDPFLLQVMAGKLDGEMSSEDIGCFDKPENEGAFVNLIVVDEVQDFGGEEYVYLCIPIGRVWTDDPGDPNDSRNAPNRKVYTEMAESELERMARAAIAMGVSDAKGARRANAR